MKYCFHLWWWAAGSKWGHNSYTGSSISSVMFHLRYLWLTLCSLSFTHPLRSGYTLITLGSHTGQKRSLTSPSLCLTASSNKHEAKQDDGSRHMFVFRIRCCDAEVLRPRHESVNLYTQYCHPEKYCWPLFESHKRLKKFSEIAFTLLVYNRSILVCSQKHNLGEKARSTETVPAWFECTNNSGRQIRKTV